ncbi:MAG: hypothetical protein WDA14_11015 [Sphaerochaetaceae bacterium]|nr:hypothetical protein [Sphaerochaetaceae bacterium]
MLKTTAIASTISIAIPCLFLILLGYLLVVIAVTGLVTTIIIARIRCKTLQELPVMYWVDS